MRKEMRKSQKMKRSAIIISQVFLLIILAVSNINAENHHAVKKGQIFLSFFLLTSLTNELIHRHRAPGFCLLLRLV